MMKQATLIFFFLTACKAFAQPTQFQKLYGSNNEGMIGYEIAHASNSEIIYCGAKYSSTMNAMLMKLNINGDTVWTRFYDTGNDDLFSTLKKLNDNTVLAGGFSGTSPLLVKADMNANIIWSKLLLANGINNLREVVPLSDSGFIALADGYELTCIFRMDANGNTVWSAFFDDMNYYDAIQLDDGSIMACGSYSAFPSVFGFSDIALMKFDINGNVLWEKLIGNSVFQSAVSLLQGSDGNIYITGQLNDPSGDSDIILMETDTSGNLNWLTIFNTGSQDVAIEITSLYLDQLMINGHSADSAGVSYGFLLRTDESGIKHWFMHYGDTITNGCWSMLDIDSGFLLGGHTYHVNDDTTAFRAVLIRTDTMGISGCYEASPPISQQSVGFSSTSFNSYVQLPVAFIDTALTVTSGTEIVSRCPVAALNDLEGIFFNIYPNPSPGQITLEGQFDELSSMNIFTIEGKSVSTTTTFQEKMNISLEPGLYLGQFLFKDGRHASVKIIIL